MPHEQRVRELEQTLSLWGLDVGRYTTALAESFLVRWPDAEQWRLSEARSALISTFAIGETLAIGSRVCSRACRPRATRA